METVEGDRDAVADRELNRRWNSQISSPPELKTVRYENGRRTGRVMYAVFGTRIVFSGIFDDAPSTINHAERIIAAILGNEEIQFRDLSEFTFYDLQTHHGYSHYPRGWYCLNRLKLGRVGGHFLVGVARWVEEPCPEIVFQVFREFHGAEKRHSAKELLQMRSVPSAAPAMTGALRLL